MASKELCQLLKYVYCFLLLKHHSTWQVVIPAAGMLKARMSKRKVESQKTEGGVPEIICTLLLQHSLSLTRNRAKLADSNADAMMVNKTSNKSPADQ